jgi:hypothetical protein
MMKKEEMQDRIATACRNGDKISLIKLHREITGDGLKESKDAVENVTPYGQVLNSDTYTSMLAMFENLPTVKRVFMDKLIKGITILATNWQDLGYTNLPDAIEAFMVRIREW